MLNVKSEQNYSTKFTSNISTKGLHDPLLFQSKRAGWREKEREKELS